MWLETQTRQPPLLLLLMLRFHRRKIFKTPTMNLLLVRSLHFYGFTQTNYRALSILHGSTIRRAARVLQSRVAVPSNRKSLYGFRTFSTSEDFAAKKCVPCNSKEMRPMTEESANHLLPKVDGWELAKEGEVLKLSRSWKVKSFIKGLEFFRLVGDVAESEGHHPDLHLISWNNVTIDIWTHAVGGLTENDFILAAKINGLELQDLLRRKAKAVDARLE